MYELRGTSESRQSGSNPYCNSEHNLRNFAFPSCLRCLSRLRRDPEVKHLRSNDKNAHLRFGCLTYVKSTEKTTTNIKLRLERCGEMLPDPPRQAKAHLVSVIGVDKQIAAVSAAI